MSAMKSARTNVGHDERTAGSRGRPAWRGVVLGGVVTLIALAIMWWGIASPNHKGEGAVVTTCTAEQQRCRMGGPKLGLCAALPDGSLQCQSQH